MKTGSAKRCWIALLLSGASSTYAADRSTEILLPAAIAGQPYAYQIATSTPDATFRQINTGSSGWLTVSPTGLLSGVPDKAAPERSTITVEADAGGVRTLATFAIPVEVTFCPATEAGQIGWCEPRTRASLPQVSALSQIGAVQTAVNSRNLRFAPPTATAPKFTIIQFSRIEGDYGSFSTLAGARLIARLSWIRAVNASKVVTSGSILIQKHIVDCSMQQWRVVTESTDSSNILIYSPGDVNVFCQPEKDKDHKPTGKSTLYIVLPVHAIWANVFGPAANTHDPTWRPLGALAAALDCSGSPTGPRLPPQQIRPCDSTSSVPDEKTRPNLLTKVYYLPLAAWTYNHLTQPGVTQGAISISPWDLSTKETWDMQAYLSWRNGPGWWGIGAVAEHDKTAQDDLNSVTGGLTYDLRPGESGNFMWSAWHAQANHPSDPPLVGLRMPEFNVKPFGLEFQPRVSTPRGDKRDTNLIGGGTVRLPIVFNFFHDSNPNRVPLSNRFLPNHWLDGLSIHEPSAMTILPVFGYEGGGSVNPPANDPSETQWVSRLVGGVDATLRWPFLLTHNFLGSRPITLDYSYRFRYLFEKEPYIDELWTAAMMQGAPHYLGGPREYERLTLIMPMSAYLQVRAACQRGALPPVFQFAHNVFTLGVSFSNPGSVEY